MPASRTRPALSQVRIEDRFWTPYLEKIRTVTLPYVFDQFEKTGYLQNYAEVAQHTGAAHQGPPFSDGLVLESMRGACDFLALYPDAALEARMDALIALISSAAAPDGFLSTYTMQQCPDQRWGENGGNIIHAHDLYNHGALIEAAISHYRATGKTTLLKTAVRAANLISSTIGFPPKKNVIPGHSLPEEALVKLHVLFRDTRALDAFADENAVHADDYLETARFFYENRGNHDVRGICPDPRFPPQYNQDHVTFSQQTQAVGHAVRAMLCYTGAAALSLETGSDAYLPALRALWENVTQRKMHVSGGVGTRHDIEGFDIDYNLPNNAYLETCAGVGLAFFGAQMALLATDSDYFDVFERALYNNVLASVGEDFTHYFYQNPLVSDGTIHRWAWHGCPCCPPMLLKLFSALGTFIYDHNAQARKLHVHLYIGSRLSIPSLSLTQNDRTFSIDSHGKTWTLFFRVPNYATRFALCCDGKPVECAIENGYARVTGVFSPDMQWTVSFDEAPHRVCAHPTVEADRGLVCVMRGPFLLCAEGVDNGGRVDFTLAKHAALTCDGDAVTGTTADGSPFRLIPYYRWCNRDGLSQQDATMAVWLRQDGMTDEATLRAAMGSVLYAVYDEIEAAR